MCGQEGCGVRSIAADCSEVKVICSSRAFLCGWRCARDQISMCFIRLGRAVVDVVYGLCSPFETVKRSVSPALVC